MLTPCECPLAGYCNRHKVNKSIKLHELCQTKMNYFQAWEEGRGPRQNEEPQEITNTGASYYLRRAICDGCSERTSKGCRQYIRPCTVKQLWHDQIEPPTNCTRKDKFYE